MKNSSNEIQQCNKHNKATVNEGPTRPIPAPRPSKLDYRIPLPIKKYTTTNPNTLSPTYHLLYDLTSSPGSDRRQPSQMKRSPELFRARAGVSGESSPLHSSQPIDETFVSDHSTPDERYLGDDPHLITLNSQQKDGRKRDDANPSVWTGYCHTSTANISAWLQTHETQHKAGGLVSSLASQRVKTSQQIIEKRVAGFPHTAGFVAANILKFNGLSEDSALYPIGVTCDTTRQLGDNVQPIGLEETSDKCGDLFHIRDKGCVSLNNIRDDSLFHNDSTDKFVSDHSDNSMIINHRVKTSSTNTSITSDNSKITEDCSIKKRAIFKRDGDSVRLFLVEDYKEYSDDSDIVPNNKVPVIKKPPVNNKDISRNNNKSVSLLPSFLRSSLKGKTKKPSQATSSPSNLIQITNNLSRNHSKKIQLNRWLNLDIHRSVPGYTASAGHISYTGHAVSTEQDTTSVTPNYSVVNKPSFSQPFHRSPIEEVKRRETTVDPTDSSGIKSISVNETFSRGHTQNSVQFINHHSQSPATTFPDSAEQKISSSDTYVIDRNKYIIKPREITGSCDNGTVTSPSAHSLRETVQFSSPNLSYNLEDFTEPTIEDSLTNNFLESTVPDTNLSLSKDLLRQQAAYCGYHTESSTSNGQSTGQENGQQAKVRPRQKFEQRCNKVNYSYHRSTTSNITQTTHNTTLIQDYKESPRAKFERHRASRSQAVVTGSAVVTEGKSSEPPPPPLPPRARNFASPASQFTDCNNTDSVESNSFSKSVILQSAYQYNIQSRDSTANQNNLVSQTNSVEQYQPSYSQRDHRSVTPDVSPRDNCTAPPDIPPRDHFSAISDNSIVTHHTSQTTDETNNDQFFRPGTVQQLRQLFLKDHSSLSTLSCSHSNAEKSSVHQQTSKNLQLDITIPDSPLNGDNPTVSAVHSLSSNKHLNLSSENYSPSIDDDYVQPNGQHELQTIKSSEKSKRANEVLVSASVASSTQKSAILTKNDPNNNISLASEQHSSPGINSLILSCAEAEMLAAKGLRIYDSVDDYETMMRSPLHKSLSDPHFIGSYVIVPTVFDDSKRSSETHRDLLNDIMRQQHFRDVRVPAYDSAPNDINKVTFDDNATYITMTSTLGRGLNVSDRTMSVEVLTPNGQTASNKLEADTPERGYVEWRTCSGWVKAKDFRPSDNNRNSQGYVDWEAIWGPRSGNKEDEHVYDVIGEEPPSVASDTPDDLESGEDTPPALPERTYIHKLKQIAHEDTELGRHHHHSKCHSHGRRQHHHHHHRHHHHHHSHGKPPPPPIPSEPIHTNYTSPINQSDNYAEVNKLKGYTFSHLLQPSDPPPKPHRPDRSVISSENYWRLAPETSTESLTSWQTGDVLDFIDGLHDSMSSKRRENIYILLNNKKTRAKVSESLEIEFRLLSRGLIANTPVFTDDTPVTGKVRETRSGESKPDLVKKKLAPVTSTYV